MGVIASRCGSRRGSRHGSALACAGGLMRGEPGRGEAVGECGERSFSSRAACGGWTFSQGQGCPVDDGGVG